MSSLVVKNLPDLLQVSSVIGFATQDTNTVSVNCLVSSVHIQAKTLLCLTLSRLNASSIFLFPEIKITSTELKLIDTDKRAAKIG